MEDNVKVLRVQDWRNAVYLRLLIKVASKINIDFRIKIEETTINFAREYVLSKYILFPQINTNLLFNLPLDLSRNLTNSTLCCLFYHYRFVTIARH